MSGETRQSVSDWTTDTLKEYLEEKVGAVDRRLAEGIGFAKETAETANKTAQVAIDKAEAATAAKFANVNEFRQALSDQSDRMMPRVEADTRYASMQEKIDGVMRRIDELNRRMLLREGAESGIGKTRDDSRTWNTNIIGWVVALAIAVAAYLGRHA